jgi:hypothetical protein
LCIFWHNFRFGPFSDNGACHVRYYFHIYQRGALIPDEEGSECLTLEAAKLEAKASAADLARQALARGEPADGLCVEIRDEDDRILAALTIREVLAHPRHPHFDPSCGNRASGSLH